MELAIETELPLKHIYELLSEYYKVSVDEIKIVLKKQHKEWFKNNNIVIYIEGKPIKRTAIYMSSNKILSKLFRRINITNRSELTKDDKKFIMKELRSKLCPS